MTNKRQAIELPVYKSSYLLLLYSFKLIKNLAREYKYPIGEKIKNEMMDLLMNVYTANKTKLSCYELSSHLVRSGRAFHPCPPGWQPEY